MKQYLKYPVVLIAVFAILFSSCKDKKEKEDFSDIKGNYFSIDQFIRDEWNTFHGEGFTIIKTVRKDNKTDSSYTTSDTLNWGNIFKVFHETEISDRKFLGKYKFTQFDDNADDTHNFFYEAEDEELFTQKLLITISQENAKVKGIYIETSKKTIWGNTIQKLYYNPLKTIQIQTDYKPMIGSKEFTVVQYDFMR